MQFPQPGMPQYPLQFRPAPGAAFDPSLLQYGYPNAYNFPQPQAFGYSYDMSGMGPTAVPQSSVPKQAPAPPPADFPGPFSVFLGDLGREVVETMLQAAFAHHGLMPKAVKIMHDQATGRSKGFGFVLFGTRAEAERAIAEMQQVLVGSRRIRLAWGSHHKWGGGGATAPSAAAGPSPLPPALGAYNPAAVQAAMVQGGGVGMFNPAALAPQFGGAGFQGPGAGFPGAAGRRF